MIWCQLDSWHEVIIYPRPQLPLDIQNLTIQLSILCTCTTLLSTYSNCIAYTIKKAMDECVWSLNPICNTCLLFGHGTTENTYSSSTYVGDGQFSGRDRGGVIATFMRIELSYCYFCWPTKQNKYMRQEYILCMYI